MPILETPGLQSQRQSSPTWPNLGQISLPALTFTILWPTFNLCYLVAIQLELGVLNPNLLIGTALDELERQDKNRALITMCIGLGMGIATIIERA